MPRGVYVFQVIDEKHIQHAWVRQVLGCSRDRYGRLRRGEVLFRHDERERLIAAMRHTYGIGGARLFGREAEVLPSGRVRRGKGSRGGADGRASTAA